MQSKNGFIAGLFVLALCALFGGGIDLYDYVDIQLHSQQATMELADPDENVVLFADVLNTRTLDVRYVSSEGNVVVPQKLVSLAVAERLAAGEKISITYLMNNPKRSLNEFHRPPNPWVWLAVGLIALATAIYALKLRKRELEKG